MAKEGIELGLHAPPPELVNTIPANAMWYQLMTPKAVLDPKVTGPQMDLQAMAPDLNSISGEVVRRGLMNKPHVITLTIAIVSRA